jgi:hypothetical protein
LPIERGGKDTEIQKDVVDLLQFWKSQAILMAESFELGVEDRTNHIP